MFDVTFLDFTQFAMEPLRTGVQRVLIGCTRNMPSDAVMPFRVIDERTVAILDPAILKAAERFFKWEQPSQRQVAGSLDGSKFELSQERMAIAAMAHSPLALVPADRFFRRARRIVNLEAFTAAERSQFYINCPKPYRHKVYHFIHDFLLFEQPHVFPQLSWRRATDYVLLFEAYSIAGGYYVAGPAMERKIRAYFPTRRQT